jgi:hypothetical protein
VISPPPPLFWLLFYWCSSDSPPICNEFKPLKSSLTLVITFANTDLESVPDHVPDHVHYAWPKSMCMSTCPFPYALYSCTIDTPSFPSWCQFSKKRIAGEVTPSHFEVTFAVVCALTGQQRGNSEEPGRYASKQSFGRQCCGEQTIIAYIVAWTKHRYASQPAKQNSFVSKPRFA